MILQTGGSAVGATSTKSRLELSALRKASWIDMMPTCSPFGPMTRTSELEISALRLTRLPWTILRSSLRQEKTSAAAHAEEVLRCPFGTLASGRPLP
jgi:hypothetical protein